jgi:antitoxin VapB
MALAKQEPTMDTAKIMKNGNSQVVQLPKAYEFDASEVQIFRRGDEIVLKRRPGNLAEAFELLTEMSDDFMAAGRCQPSVQDREPL